MVGFLLPVPLALDDGMVLHNHDVAVHAGLLPAANQFVHNLSQTDFVESFLLLWSLKYALQIPTYCYLLRIEIFHFYFKKSSVSNKICQINHSKYDNLFPTDKFSSVEPVSTACNRIVRYIDYKEHDLNSHSKNCII